MEEYYITSAHRSAPSSAVLFFSFSIYFFDLSLANAEKVMRDEVTHGRKSFASLQFGVALTQSRAPDESLYMPRVKYM